MISIKDFCVENSLPWSDAIESKTNTYTELLLKYNKTMNLIGPMDSDEIQSKLFVDSLVAALAEKPRGRILDVGSGAGLPGIVLGIFYPETSVTLVEPRRKRADFLSLAVRTLELKDAVVFQKRIEVVPPDTYDYVIAKAFRKPVEWLKIAEKWTKPNGSILCLHTSESDMRTTLNLKNTVTHETLNLSISKKERAVSVFTINAKDPLPDQN